MIAIVILVVLVGAMVAVLLVGDGGTTAGQLGRVARVKSELRTAQITHDRRRRQAADELRANRLRAERGLRDDLERGA